MARFFKTSIMLTALLATLALPALARGRNNRVGSVRSGISRSTTMQPVARRLSQPINPTRNTGGTQLRTPRLAPIAPRTNAGSSTAGAPRVSRIGIERGQNNPFPSPNRRPSADDVLDVVVNDGSRAPRSPIDRLRDRGSIAPIIGSRDNGNSLGNPIIPPGVGVPRNPDVPNDLPDSLRPDRGNAGPGDRPVSPVDPAAGVRDRQPIDPTPPRNPSPDDAPPANGGTDTPPSDTPPNNGGPNPSPDAPVDTPNDGRDQVGDEPRDDVFVPPPADTPVEEPPLVQDGGATGELIDVKPVDEVPADELPAEEAPVSDTATLVTDLLSQIIGGVGAAPSAGDFPAIDPGIVESVATATEPPIMGAASEEAIEAVAEAAAEAAAMDLEITDVRLVEPGDVKQDVGPRYRIFCRNNGSVELSKFHVTVLADLGKKLTEKAEIVAVEAVGMLPGSTQTVDVRLPVSVLKMIPKDSKAKPFEMFVAFADSDERFAESDEENNIVALTRDAIKPLKSDAETERAAADQAKPKSTEETK